MTNLSTLFPSVTVRDVYTPGTWKFTGAERWYDTAYTGAGNQITIVARFKTPTFTGAATQQCLIRGFGNNYSQGALFCYSTTFTTPTTRQGCFRFLVQSTTGTTLCDLFTEPDIWMDDEWHIIVASYDGTAGTAVMYIDGVAAIDATNAEHTLTTGTPRGGSNDFVVGSAITTSLYPYVGHIGYIGFCETYVTDWTLFMNSDYTPKKIDEVNWTEFNGVQPLYWSEHGELVKGNKGSGGELVRSANCVLSDAPVTRSGLIYRLIKPGDLLLHDTFIDSDGVAINDHRPDRMDLCEGGWTTFSESPTILSNSLEENANATAILGVVCGSPDVIVTMTGRVAHISADFGVTGVAIRIQDSSNYWACIPKSLSTTPWTFGIYSVIGGSQVERISANGVSGGSATNVTLDYVVTVRGSVINFVIASENIDLTWNTAGVLDDMSRHGLRMSNVSSPSAANRANCSEIMVVAL